MLDPIALLQDLIRHKSVTPEAAGVFDLLEATLRPLGFSVTRLRFEGDGSYPVDNLFATRDGGGPHLLFNGHTDVVPTGDRTLWRRDPFGAELDGGYVYGRGAADMKSGLAAFIAALAATPPAGRVSLALTNDEEADGVNGTEKLMAWAAAHGHRFDFAIVGEPSANATVGDQIKIGRRGSLSGKITVAGRQGHVAYPQNARNPLPVAARIVTALSGELDAGTAHFPPSNLEFTTIDTGNKAGNVIPAATTLACNVRFNDGWTPESLHADLARRLAALAEDGVAVEFEVAGRPSRAFLSPTGGAVTLLAEVIAAETGAGLKFSTAGGTSDARFIAPYCPVVECGLPGPTMHQVDECVKIADVLALTRLYRAFLARYWA